MIFPAEEKILLFRQKRRKPLRLRHQLNQQPLEPWAKRGVGPGGARAVFYGFDYGKNDWVYVDVDDLWDVVAER